MNDSNSRRDYNSGLFAPLSGSHKSIKPDLKVVEIDMLTHAMSANNILSFSDIRTRVFRSCVEAERCRMPMSVLMVGVDDWSILTRRYGDDSANLTDRFMMKTLASQRRMLFGSQHDVAIGQYIAGRFIILLPGTAGMAAMEIAEYFRKAVSENCLIMRSEAMNITASIGVAHKPGHAGSHDHIILQADQACADSQYVGGNKVSVGRITEGFTAA